MWYTKEGGIDFSNILGRKFFNSAYVKCGVKGTDVQWPSDSVVSMILLANDNTEPASSS
jgi:hypothetical protein